MPDKPPQKTEKSDSYQEPHVDGFRLRAERVTSLESIVEVLSPLQFLEIISEGDALVLINVESRDIQRNPYLFSMTYLRPDRIELRYTVTPGVSPSKRRLDIFRFLLNLLTVLEDSYNINSRELYQLLDGGLKALSEFTSSNYDEIFAKYDNLTSEVSMLHKRVESLLESNERLGKDNMDLKSRNDELLLRVRDLESLSDDTLMLRIQEWVTDHNNEINIGEFSRVYKVSETRVEEMLNRMVTQGFLVAKR